MTLLNILWIWFVLMACLFVGLLLSGFFSYYVGFAWWILAGFGIYRWRLWAKSKLANREGPD